MSTPSGGGNGGERDQMMSALFASLVMQNTNMALIFLGAVPNPQTGQTSQDLDHARHFIDQLEMIAVKTRGNLDKQEEAMLKQSLTSLRMAFVEAAGRPQTVAPAEIPATPPSDEQETPVTEPAAPSPDADAEESRKKFSKKYQG